MFSSYKRLDCYSLLQHPLPGVVVHVVRAANSDRWSQKELQQLEELEKPSEQPKVILPRHCSASCSAIMVKHACACRSIWKQQSGCADGVYSPEACGGSLPAVAL